MTERRTIELAGLLQCFPEDIGDRSIAGRQALIQRMARKLSHLRRLGLAGDHAYSVPLHTNLYREWQRECAELEALTRAEAA